MRLSELFGQTQRQVGRFPPEDGRHWLMRAAYLHESEAGHAWLPLGVRLRDRVWALLSAAWERAAAQKVDWPLFSGALPWRLPPAEAALLGAHVASYRQLPRLLWGQPGERLSVLVLAETPAAARERATALHARWEETLARLGMAVRRGEGAPAAGASAAVTFVASAGGQETLHCPACGYIAPAAWARRGKPEPAAEPLQPMTPVETPHANTIAALAEFLGVPESRTAKAVFLRTREAAPRLVFAVVRGDMQVSEAKLARLLGVTSLEAAAEADIRKIGAEPGYASPVGVRGALVVVDDLIPRSPNLVAGANRSGYHFTGVNYGRDFQADVVGDIAAAEEGNPCPRCGASLQPGRAWPLIVSQGLAHDLTYLTREGKSAPMGVAAVQADGYAILTVLAEAARREDGLAWPPPVAPYDVHLIALRGGEEAADTLYRQLKAAGVAVLYDDRKASPGVKFADADLIGLPWRVTVGKRSLKRGGAEIKPRHGEADVLPLEAVVAYLTRL